MLTIDTPRFTITLKIQVFLIMNLKHNQVQEELQIKHGDQHPSTTSKNSNVHFFLWENSNIIPIEMLYIQCTMAICDNILCKFHQIPFSGVGGVAHKRWVSPQVNDKVHVFLWETPNIIPIKMLNISCTMALCDKDSV